MARVRDLFLLSIGAVGVAFIIEYLRDFLRAPTYCYTSIKTLSDLSPTANCFTVSRSGLFKRVFRDQNPDDVVQGHVLPGLWDGHGHVLQYGEMLHSADLFQTNSLQDARNRVKSYLQLNPNEGSRSSWIRGIGWDQAAFHGRMPTAVSRSFGEERKPITHNSKQDLEQDLELKGKYIMLDRVDVHCIWVSQAVLDLLPTPLSEEIPGGEIVREPGLGVFCDNAMDFVRKYFPTPSDEIKSKWLSSSMRSLNSVGIVGVHDAGVMPAELALYKKRVDLPDWTVRIYAMFECAVRNTFCPEQAKKISRTDGMLEMRSVKLFADGALGSWGSAMIDPYHDKPETSGTLLVNGTTLTTLAKDWASQGYQVNIHAIGDLANRLSINALTAALFSVCPNDYLASCQSKKRYRIEHAQIIHINDQLRMNDIGIIPSIQPTHATSDMVYAEDRLGKERLNQEAYRMKSLLGIVPVLGSDFPVEPANPFEGIFAAVARRNPRTGLGPDGSADGWHMEQALTVEEALRGFTINPARGAFLEGKAGIIQDGAFADWIVLDEPLESLEVDDLRHVKVRETWVSGKRVYSRDG